MKGDTCHQLAMAGNLELRSPGRQIPDLQFTAPSGAPAAAAGGQAPPVRAKAQAAHRLLVSPQRENFALVVQIPDSDRLIPARGSKPQSVRTEGHVMNEISVAAKRE